VWRSPEEIIKIAFARSRVVLANEAHDGLRRCIRTRRIGMRMIQAASVLEVCHLAMEALWDPAITEHANRERRLPTVCKGYLAQPEMGELIQLALDLDWTLHSYEADLSHRPPGLDDFSIEATNWREQQQANNIAHALAELPVETRLLVWCGNHHLARRPLAAWRPMGSLLAGACGVEPFAIDQAATVRMDRIGNRAAHPAIAAYAGTLEEFGGTAGFLAEDAPPGWPRPHFADAYLLSTDNELS
jgi:hypothetical protein